MHCFEDDFIIRDIPGFPNYQINEIGQVYNKKNGKEMKQYQSSNGYMAMSLNKNIKGIHELVALTFIENTNNKPYVDHIDRNKKNNRIENLRYVTNQENQQNRGMMTTNTSGVTGVKEKPVTCNGIVYYYWIGHIRVNGKSKEKNFPHTDEGLQQAIEWRKHMEDMYFTVDKNILVYKQ